VMKAAGAPSRAEARERMEREWAALEEALAGLDEAQMLETGVVEGWSVKDLLGHMAFWAQEAGRNVELVQAGRERQVKRPEGTEVIDRWNAREQRLRAGRSLVEVRRELEESHRRALDALAGLAEEKLSLDLDIGLRVSGTLLELYAVDTYDHYQEHAEQILAWRRRGEHDPKGVT